MRRHLDAAQAGVGKAREARLDQRRLAGAARAGQQRVIGRMARDKLRKVVEKLTFDPVDAQQAIGVDPMQVRNRLKVAISPSPGSRSG